MMQVLAILLRASMIVYHALHVFNVLLIAILLLCVCAWSICLDGFCRYLLVLDIFCHFVSWHAALVVCKFVTRNASKIEPQLCPNPLNFIKNPSEIDQNGALEHSERDLGGRSARSRPPPYLFWSFWSHLGDFGRHFGASWVPRGLKIEHFGTKSRKNINK